MRTIATVVLVCFAAACATPYQPMGLRGGYEDSTVGGGVISIHVRGNGHTSSGTVMEYAYRRAGELCAAGFDIVDSNGSVRSSWQASGDTMRQVDRPEITMLVRCRQGPGLGQTSAAWEVPPQPKPQPAPHESFPATTGWWCESILGNTNTSSCLRLRADCEHMRDLMAQSGYEQTDCAPQGAAACYTRVRNIDGGVLNDCGVSMSSCEAMRAATIQATSTDWTVTGQCRRVE